MKLLKRNLTEFEYRPFVEKEEVLDGTRHTGRFRPVYGDPVTYSGNISIPSGFVTNDFFGIKGDYTHVLVTDDPDMDITEAGLIDWKGNTYEIKAVRPSLNVLSVALKKVTE